MGGRRCWRTPGCYISSRFVDEFVAVHLLDPTDIRSDDQEDGGSEHVRTSYPVPFRRPQRSRIPPGCYTCQLHLKTPSPHMSTTHHMHTTALRGQMVLIRSECTSHSVFLSMHPYPNSQPHPPPQTRCRGAIISRHPLILAIIMLSCSPCRCP